jgi:phosphohistidine phosphatase SixA
MDMMRVYIIRHGETEENKQKIIQGHLDTLLNSKGERQANLVAVALKDVPFDVCYSSDLRRAVDTAKRILIHHSNVELQTQEAVREQVCQDGFVKSLFSVATHEAIIVIVYGHFPRPCGGEKQGAHPLGERRKKR